MHIGNYNKGERLGNVAEIERIILSGENRYCARIYCNWASIVPVLDMIINRLAEKQLSGKLQKGKVLILYGTRRTGKTFLFEHLYASNRWRR